MAELDTNVTTEVNQEAENAEQETTVTENPELAKIRAEMAKLKAANDKLSKENSEKTKALRAKQSAEEVAAEEAKAQQEALMQELETLRREKAVAATTAKILPMVGDGEISGQIAEYLYGAEDVDAALTALQKAWTAKEKALRLEYGKIPAPGAGGTDGPTITKAQLDAMNYSERVKFANEHADEYNKLMGR
jgi:hypothetical protein